MIQATLFKSKLPDKKWSVIVLKNGVHRTIHFGDKNFQDFTQHKNEERKRLYIARHRSREDWTNPLTSGFWARYLLWNKSSIQQSIEDIENKFKIDIKPKF